MNLDVSIMIPIMPIGPGCLESGPLGGSETAGVSMARALAKRGHHVTVFGNVTQPAREESSGVTFVPDQHHRGHVTGHPHDVAIIQRIPAAFSIRTETRLNYLWCHDLPVMQQVREIQGVSWNLDGVALVSDWMKREYVDAGLDERILWATRNGIDLGYIRTAITDPMPGTRTFEKQPHRVVFAARPERGLDVLLKEVWPKLKRFVPDASLAICGYADASPQMAEFYASCGRMLQEINARGLGPVEWLGGLAKAELYRLLANSGCYLYPSPSPLMPKFAETSCIMSMESMACGLPFVASKRGALPETLPGNAGHFLVEGDPTQGEVSMRLAQAAAEAMGASITRRMAVEAGLAHVEALTWDGLAEEWSDRFIADLAARNDDRLRLARHFIRRQDIMAASAALDEAAPSMVKRRLRGWLEKRYAFIETPEAFQAHYEKHAMDVPEPAHAKEKARVTTAPMDRYARIAGMVGADAVNRPRNRIKVLDYGCHDGELDYLLVNTVHGGQLDILAVDLNAEGVEWGKRLQGELTAATGNKLEFRHIGHDWFGTNAPNGTVDVVICGEVLEHQPEPGAFLKKLWRTMAPGGRLILTVPYGPWELGNLTQPAMHLWEFDLHDLRDLFGHLDGYEVSTWRTGENEVTGDAVGYRVVTCLKADGRKGDELVKGDEPGEVDMQRKTDLQRPRQSLSANLIVGGKSAAETLRWCLTPLRTLCEDIVVGDCGMDANAFAIAEEFGCRVIKVPDPISAGFDSARNTVLGASATDWVLWIDSDEKLVGSECVTKYLRQNRFASYAVRQIHFAVDTAFKPDMPARLIRAGGHDGKQFRFYGYVHEHAELGDLNAGPGSVLVLTDVNIGHLGYLNERTRRLRFVRNLPMLAEDARRYPDRRIQKYLLCRDNMHIAQYEMERNGGRVSETVKRASEETIELYRKHFIGQPEMMGMDCLQFYAQACRLLGIGFDVNLSLAVGKMGVEFQTNMPTVRYANQDDFMLDVAARAKDMTRHYDKGYW